MYDERVTHSLGQTPILCPICGRSQGWNGHAYAPCADRRKSPRLDSPLRASVTSATDWDGIKRHGITDGVSTILFMSQTAARDAARIHNLVHGHTD